MCWLVHGIPAWGSPPTWMTLCAVIFCRHARSAPVVDWNHRKGLRMTRWTGWPGLPPPRCVTLSVSNRGDFNHGVSPRRIINTRKYSTIPSIVRQVCYVTIPFNFSSGGKSIAIRAITSFLEGDPRTNLRKPDLTVKRVMQIEKLSICRGR